MNLSHSGLILALFLSAYVKVFVHFHPEVAQEDDDAQ